MSLRDSIKDLRNAARRLDTVEFHPSMNALEKFLSGIKVDKPATPPEDVLEKLLAKYLRGENLDSKDRRNLPFIIYEDEITFNDTIKILNMLDFSKTSHLRRVVSVYLLSYDNTPKTKLLRERLDVIREVDSVSLKKIFAARDKLFSENHMANISKFLAQKLSVTRVIEEFGLSNFYKASNFIQTALINFFRSNVAKISDQFEILDELDAEFDTYKNVFPVIADTLIQLVALTGFGKKKCIEIFYRRLGDPRFGDKRFNWNSVSQKSKDIFSQWLSEEDLETFFELIRQTAVNRMWLYREKFWRVYLPYIIKTKIFLGNNAKYLAARMKNKVKLNHGTLTGAADNQSVFVFQIGQFIFSEWSHDGKLRVHEIESTLNLFEIAEDFFDRNFIGRDVLMKNFKAEWIHSSPRTYSWQNKVSEWLKINCGVIKTENDWGIKD